MSAVAEMVDASFAVAGETLPADHAHALWLALLVRLPWLADEPAAGVHPLRGAETAEGELLLARRARLVLRLPAARLESARALQGEALEVAGRRLGLGEMHARPLAAATTLYARLVASEASDESRFSAEIAAALVRAGVPCRFICGRRRRLAAGEREIAGHSVVLHGIPLARSRELQAVGLGPERGLGCGLLVPHKTISGLD